jgi:bacilysin biosynthesis protein BacA
MLEDLEHDMVFRLEQLRSSIAATGKVRIATLGPGGTSSDLSARYLLDNIGQTSDEPLLFDSYERAAETVLANEANLLVVANAYANVDRFYMDPALYFLCAYFFQTPEYGVAARKDFVHAEGKTYRMVSHPAPLSLIPWFLANTGISAEVSMAASTAAAAKAVRDGEVELCVTNGVARERYDLTFITRTRPIRMLWSVFERKRPDGTGLF